MVREAAVKHGWTLSSSPTDVGLVIDADINRSKITTTEYTNWGAREQEGYHMAYIASFQFGFVTQGYCRRGDKFVQVDAFPLWGARFSNDCMGDLVDFKANYREAFEQAVDGVFNDLAESGKSDNTDNDDEAAWAASLWPKARDAEMAKSFLSAVNSEARGSNRIFTGVSRFTVVPVDFAEEGSEELDAHSIEESWTSELNRNGYEVDAGAEVRIKTFAGAWRRSGIGVPGYYVNESFVRVQQNNVVFRFNGQLRRRRAYIWSTLNTAIALPREQSDTARKLMDESIRSAAKEFALRR